jgi:Kef-type K+ transport system membrane component KefB
MLLVAVALIFARVCGYIFDRLKQPAVIGEIIAGIVLGGVVMVFFSGQHFFLFSVKLPLPELDFFSDEFVFLAELGILFLLFISGLETRISRLKEVEVSATMVAVGGVVVPLVLGFFAGVLIQLSLQESVILGLILVATSVGVTVRTLMDLHVLHTNVGATILSGAVIDDVIGIILLAFVLGIESVLDALWIGVRIVIFFLIFLILGLKVINKVLDLGEKITLPKALLSISLAILLIYSFFADKAGISGIIGAFVAGILIGQTLKSHKIIEDVQTIGYSFFIPLFFVFIGASIWQENVSWDVTTVGVFVSLFIVIGIVGKICGCGIGAFVSGMTGKESLQVGIGMIPRMELALIIVSSAITQQLVSGEIAHELLVSTIILTVVTTLLTPFLLKAVFKP